MDIAGFTAQICSILISEGIAGLIMCSIVGILCLSPLKNKIKQSNFMNWCNNQSSVKQIAIDGIILTIVMVIPLVFLTDYIYCSIEEIMVPIILNLF